MADTNQSPENARQTKYKVGSAVYRVGRAFQFGVGELAEPVIETWFYQGYFKLDWNTTDCDIPHHFYVFQPFVTSERTLDRPPQQGLKIPSLRGVELSMLTFDELLGELNRLKEEQSQRDHTGDSPMVPTMPTERHGDSEERIEGTTRSSHLAIIGLVLGCLGVLLGPLISVPGIVCGHLATRQIRRSHGPHGELIAMAALIVGYIGLALHVVLGTAAIVYVHYWHP